MKVKVLRGFCLGKGIDVQPGETIDLADREARIKIRQGKVRDAALPEKVKQTCGKKQQPAKPLLYPLDEALQLIAYAPTVEEVDAVIEGDTRPEVLEAATARKEQIAQGGADNA